MCVVTEAADEMETVLPDAIAESPVGEECVSHDEMGEYQQILAVPLDHPNVVLCEGLVAQLQLGGTLSLVGTKHHAVVGINVINPSPMISSPCFTAPAHPDQKRPICGGILPALLVKLGSTAMAFRPTSPKNQRAREMFRRSQLTLFERLRPKFCR